MARLSRENRTGRPAARLRRPAKVAAERPAVRLRRTSGDTPYHHGDLHEALLQAAERVLERDGIAGLTLRAVAREAGVSHAAPTHHFGDLTGLLSELAAIGFRMFNTAMIAARASEAHPLMKALANAKAYVAYAQAHPGMYSLMFRNERLDMTRPSLHESPRAARRPAFRSISPARRWRPCRSTRPRRSRVTGRWSTASPCCCSTDG
jgi:AcrR family transcriptional regulator